MREGWPSLTAAIVALGRGVGLDDTRRDVHAHRFAPGIVGRAVERVAGPGIAAPLLRNATRVATLGLVDHATLRMAAIDAAVRDAASAGCTQLVVLGAGLDTRAFRMPELAGVDVFEVDHPSTQAFKRARAAGMDVLSRSHRYVAVDFERDRLGDRLAEAGHEPKRSTVWVWEGVTMYLRDEAIDATLEQVSARSPVKSRLAATYAASNTSLGTHGLVRAVFGALGEPLRSFFEPEALRERLSDFGFHVLDDSSSEEWARRHGGASIGPLVFRGERLSVSERAAG